MSLADRAQTEPERIARFASAKDKLAALTAEDVRAIAARYLDPAKAVEIEVLPREDAR
jgi:zinc protease